MQSWLVLKFCKVIKEENTNELLDRIWIDALKFEFHGLKFK